MPHGLYEILSEGVRNTSFAPQDIITVIPWGVLYPLKHVGCCERHGAEISQQLLASFLPVC